MRVIGVVDVRGGIAVRAHGGNRDRYEAVRSVAGSPLRPGDAVALARAYVEHLGVTDLYVADLDAIANNLRRTLTGSPVEVAVDADTGQQRPVVAELAELGAPLWLDAGVSSLAQARVALDGGATHIVVGLETLRSYDALRDISASLGRARVAFSLDLRDGEPMTGALREEGDRGRPPQAIAARAVEAGAGAVIVIDVARVGTGVGPDFALLKRVRASAPQVTLIAGGGVRGLPDVLRLADAGCDGVLIATALQSGDIDADAVATARQMGQVSPTR